MRHEEQKTKFWSKDVTKKLETEMKDKIVHVMHFADSQNQFPCNT